MNTVLHLGDVHCIHVLSVGVVSVSTLAVCGRQQLAIEHRAVVMPSPVITSLIPATSVSANQASSSSYIIIL